MTALPAEPIIFPGQLDALKILAELELVTVGSVCTGYDGLGLALDMVFGATRRLWFADPEPGPSAILAHRWPDVPNLGDLTTVDWSAVERPDVLTAGFPCQDVSCAGLRAGIAGGTRSGLWIHIARIIDTLRPGMVLIENVRGLLSARADRGLGPDDTDVEAGDGPALRAAGAVLGDLADIGYDASWTTLSASDVGAPHRRSRVVILAYPADPAVRRADGVVARFQSLARGVGSCDAAGEGLEAGRQGRPGGGATGQLMPTPCAGDSKGTRNATAERSDPNSTHSDGWTLGDVAYAGRFGQYGPAVTRWEAILDRLAPAPTEPGAAGMPAIRRCAHAAGLDGYAARHLVLTGQAGARLASLFVEWLMGLPYGHVTGVPDLTRPEELHALGNGVVPQQIAAAVIELAPTLPTGED